MKRAFSASGCDLLGTMVGRFAICGVDCRVRLGRTRNDGVGVGFWWRAAVGVGWRRMRVACVGGDVGMGFWCEVSPFGRNDMGRRDEWRLWRVGSVEAL